MLFKLAFVLATGAMAAIALHRLRESEDEAALEQEIAAQLDALRDHLFKH
jgi:hypothetical protein